jgi:site-specific recombinase XerD
MNTFKNYLHNRGLSQSTVNAYHYNVMAFIAWLDGQNIETEQVRSTDLTAYLQHLKKKGHTNATRSMQLLSIKHYFDYETAQGRREDNPAKHIKIRGVNEKTHVPIFSKEELNNIYNHYEVPKPNDTRAVRNWFTKYRLSRQRNKIILGLTVWQGLTTTEINNLELQHIKLKEGLIEINGRRKGETRTLELKPQQIVELMEYQYNTRKALLNYYNGPSNAFIIGVPAIGKNNMSKDNTINLWKRLSQELKKTTPRFVNFMQVRTSVITHWLAQYNLRRVQYMAGHRQVSTTERYLVNQVEDLQTEIEKYHPIN